MFEFSIIKERLKLQFYYKDIVSDILGYSRYYKDEHLEEEPFTEGESEKIVEKIHEFVFKNLSVDKINFFYLYFYERQRQVKIAKLCGCTQEYVSIILQRMIKEIYAYLKKEKILK